MTARRGSGEIHQTAQAGLVEREAELAALDVALESALTRSGQVVYVEAAAGMGKSRLLTAGALRAADAGMRILTGRGRELESHFDFGVAMQLFEGRWPWDDATGRERRATGPGHWPVGEDPPRGVRPATSPHDDRFVVTNGLFNATRRLSGEGHGVAFFVDDLQWVDQPTLAFLAYLAARIEALPVAVVVAADHTPMDADRRSLDALREMAGKTVLRPERLSMEGIADIVRAELPDATPDLCLVCAEATGGIPFLLSELLLELSHRAAYGEIHSDRVGELVPESVIKNVRVRLGGLPNDAVTLASAIVVLGDGVPLRQAALVAEVDVAVASSCADALAAANLLRPGAPLLFAEPLIGRAVRACMSELERGRMHLRAATVRRDEGASPQEIASHLLASPPTGDPHAMQMLRTAARSAMAGGAPEGAVRLLVRALREASEPAVRAEVFEELRTAKLAVKPIAEAIRADQEPTPAQRIALAQMALDSSVSGESRTHVVSLVDRAWGDGGLLESGTEPAQLASSLVSALLFVDEIERSLDISDAVARSAGVPSGPLPAAADSEARAWCLFHQGQVEAAAAYVAAVLDARAVHHGAAPTGLVAALVACRVQLGQFEQAEALLADVAVGDGDEDDLGVPLLLEARGQLRLAQMRPDDALADAMSAYRRSYSAAPPHPGILAWRSTAALAQLALGKADTAAELAEEELELARYTDVTRVVIRDLRILGLAHGSERGLELLAEAVELGTTYPPRLEHMHALLDLGAALRRANQRAAARVPLRRAAEIAARAGVTGLAARAREELLTTGARPRTAAFSGLEALTPSERRVADLAARGRTTRQIASALFVTPKTVEFHLRHIYRKLDVPSSRDELIKALRSDAA